MVTSQSVSPLQNLGVLDTAGDKLALQTAIGYDAYFVVLAMCAIPIRCGHLKSEFFYVMCNWLIWRCGVVWCFDVPVRCVQNSVL